MHIDYSSSQVFVITDAAKFRNSILTRILLLQLLTGS